MDSSEQDNRIEDDSEKSEVAPTEKERKSARLKALYQARMVIIRAGTPGERIASSRAMKKMEKKYGLNPMPGSQNDFMKSAKKMRTA